MKKSKLIFAVLAAAILILCLVLTFAGKRHEEEQTAATVGTTPTESEETEPPLPMSDIIIGELVDPHHHEIPENVRINKVEKDPNEVIRPYEPIPEGDPEYIVFSHGQNYASPEGRVYRNDKTISIDLFDELEGITRTITFGHITGECNAFLYLNPVCETESEPNEKYGFYFKPIVSNGGFVGTISDESIYESEEARMAALQANRNFTVRRALDQWDVAGYIDPQHPGTVWFTQTPLDGNLWLDVLVYEMSGDMVASLRLTISKGLDGTYSIVNLENADLIQNCENPKYELNKDEVGYLYTQAMETLQNPEMVKFGTTSQVELCIERVIMTYRDSYNGLYYPHIVPAEGGGVVESHKLLTEPVIAVTVRNYHGATAAVTLYFRVVYPHTDTEHGLYEYIGRDFLTYQTMDALISQGCPLF